MPGLGKEKVDKWEVGKFLRYCQLKSALGMEGLMFDSWADARQNHAFNNVKGHLEASIRIEKKVLGNGWTAYRLAAGVGGVEVESGWKPYPQGMPGGVRRKTAMGFDYDPKIPYYAIFIELGTRNMSARAFILPPILKRRADFNKTMQFSVTAKALEGV